MYELCRYKDTCKHITPKYEIHAEILRIRNKHEHSLCTLDRIQKCWFKLIMKFLPIYDKPYPILTSKRIVVIRKWFSTYVYIGFECTWIALQLKKRLYSLINPLGHKTKSWPPSIAGSLKSISCGWRVLVVANFLNTLVPDFRYLKCPKNNQYWVVPFIFSSRSSMRM